MRQLKSQEDIIATWDDPNKPVVSICCITYNHEPYIEDALEGFLIQETAFPFEILIHDDASTDRTADIIREYEAKYPKLIKPIYQVENQYSQGKKINFEFNFNRAEGDFLAICEGDDYWVDGNKVSTQLALMKNNKNIGLCVHPSNQINFENNDECLHGFHGCQIQILNPNKVLEMGGQFSPTSSYFMRKELLEDIPDWFRHLSGLPYGDFFIEIFFGKNGILYIPDVMSVYRRAVPGSYTVRAREDNNLRQLAAQYELLRATTNQIQTIDQYDEISLKKRLYLIDIEYGFKFVRSDFFKGVKKVAKNLSWSFDKKTFFLKFVSMNKALFEIGLYIYKVRLKV